MTAALSGANATSPAVAPLPHASRASSTPTRLRSVQALLAVVCVALGVTLVLSASNRRSHLNQASKASDLVEATQQLRAALGRADAASVGAFLAGGVDQPDQRARYSTAIEEAATALQVASEKATSDEARVAITTLQKLLPTYTGLIETARANNRQQLALGAAYLRSASQLLRTDVAKALDDLRQAGDRSFRAVQGDITGGIGTGPLAVIVLVALVFALAQRSLSKRTRRVLNPGVVAAAGLLVVGLGWVANATRNSAQQSVDAIVSGYDRLSSLSAVRADAYDQQASATFALVDRGARESFNAAAATAANNVEARLAALDDRSELGSDWTAYRAVSDGAADQDSGGDYAAARALAIAPISDPTGSSGLFERFDKQIVLQVDSAKTALSSSLGDARGPIDLIRVAGLVLGLLAAAVGAWGVQQRINDYR